MNDDQNTIHNDWLTEQAYIQTQQAQFPEKFVLSQSPDYYDALAAVGIILERGKPEGVIKQTSADFIVEEIQRDKSVTEVRFGEVGTIAGSTMPFVKADLVKNGIATVDVIKDMSNRLNISETKFGYSGIKDAKAITAQQITIANPPLDKLLSYKPTHYFLTNLQYSPTAISVGQIYGNRFTILVRTQNELDENAIRPELENLKSNGFWNYYWTQRFGSRLLSHYWGMLLLQGNYQKLLHSYFCESGPYDVPFFAELRQKAESLFGNWAALYDLFKPMAFTFRFELMLLSYLKEYNSDYVGALRSIPEQAKFWAYAYASFLANRMISAAAAGDIPDPKTLPLLFTNKNSELEVYKKYLKIDGVPENFREKLQRFDFIRFSSRYLQTRISVNIINYQIIPEGLVIAFDLDKGSYATTFLSNIFELKNNAEWLKDQTITPIDTKKILGTGDISEILKAFSV